MSKGHEGRPSPKHHVGAYDVVGPRGNLLVTGKTSVARTEHGALCSPALCNGGAVC